MGTRKNKRLAGTAFVSALVAASVFVACSSSDDNGNPAPISPVYYVDASSNSDATVPPGPSGDDDAEIDAPSDVREEPIVRSDAASCTLNQAPAVGATSTTCWNCAPVLQTDFTNHCAAAGVLCAPFDNKARLPGYDGGALPPL
jgi:hypothetical protein